MGRSIEQARIEVMGRGMRLEIAQSVEGARLNAARATAEIVANEPEASFFGPTGKTFEGIYPLIGASGVDFYFSTLMQLDGYARVKAPAKTRGTFTHYRNNVIFPALQTLNGNRCFIPREDALDPYVAAQEYADIIRRRTPVKLALLGLGKNGHIAFNEPGSPEDSRVRVVTLTEETRAANADDFDGGIAEVPYEAITVGIADILEAEKIILVATGIGKAEALAAMVKGPRTSDVPASFLQGHPHLHVVADEAAASLLAA